MDVLLSLFPRANSTAPSTASWHPEPKVDTRGTWSVISICGSTLFICVWKAVHVDVPLHKSFWNFVDKVGWLVVGILAPDMLLYAACCQIYNAYHVHDKAKQYLDCPPEPQGWFRRFMKRVLSRLKAFRPSKIVAIFSKKGRRYKNVGDEEAAADDGDGGEKTQQGTSLQDEAERADVNGLGNVSPHKRKHPWTLVHSFYASTGGFVFETSTPLLGSHSRFTVGVSGVAFLMRYAPDLVPDLSEDSILDRSRSDSLAPKALLIVQLLYFCISCAARWAQSLPLTLLEVSTFAHTVCAVITYIVWWKKPFDIAEPTVISGPQADEVAAYLLFVSGARRSTLAGIITFGCESEWSFVFILWPGASALDSDPSSETTVAEDGELQALDVRPGQVIRIGNFTFRIRGRAPDQFLRDWIYGRDCVLWCHRDRGPGDTARLEEQDLARWRLVVRALARFPDIHFSNDATLVTWRGGLQHSASFQRDARWSCVLSIIAVLYGSCHLLGWNATFPTFVEHIMWRAGALGMVVLGIFASVIPQIAGAHHSEYESRVLNFLIVQFPGTIYLISLAVYPIVSSFLVVEATRQLFYLPDAAFQLPNFSVYLPHFA